jgi:hypothetical protein
MEKMRNYCFIRKNFVARRVAKYKYIDVYLYECNIVQFVCCLCVCVCVCVRARARACASTNYTSLNLQNSFHGQEI